MKLAVNLAFAGRYGWHRDELYYADAGRHLMLGYVDFPAVTPWLAALSRVRVRLVLARRPADPGVARRRRRDPRDGRRRPRPRRWAPGPADRRHRGDAARGRQQRHVPDRLVRPAGLGADDLGGRRRAASGDGPVMGVARRGRRPGVEHQVHGRRPVRRAGARLRRHAGGTGATPGTGSGDRPRRARGRRPAEPLVAGPARLAERGLLHQRAARCATRTRPCGSPWS